MSSKSEGRINKFKNTTRNETQKNKRRDDIVQLRKEKRNDQLQKRRNIASGTDDAPLSPLQENNSSQNRSYSNMQDVVDGLHADHDAVLQFESTKETRKMLSTERNPPIQFFIENGAIPKLVQFLSRDNQELVFQAAWALTNIASGSSEETKAVVEANAVNPLIELLTSSNFNIAEQAMWALGNIAGDSPNLRDFVLEQGILKNLTLLAEMILAAPKYEITEISLIQNLAWTLSNLCRNRCPPTKLEHIMMMLPVLKHMLYLEDIKAVTDALWAFSYVTDGPAPRIQAILNDDVHRRMVELIGTVNESSVIIPAIRALGNIITGTDDQTQVVLEAGLLPAILNWTHHNDARNLQKELAWVLSNIMAGTSLQIQAVIDAQLLPWVTELCLNADFKTRKEAAWAITNLSSSGTEEQKAILIQTGGVEALCSMLDVPDNKIIEICLSALLNLASDEREQDTVTLNIERCGGLDKIEELQNHAQETIYKFAFSIIDTYFGEPNDENVVSSTTGTFEFEEVDPGSGGFRF